MSASWSRASYRTEIFERISIQSSDGIDPSRAGGGSGGGDFRERIGDGAVYAWIYPTLMINRYGSVMDTNWVIPLSTDRTRVHMDYYFEEPDGEDARTHIERSMKASETVQQEDVAICESVQIGLASTSFESGPYSVKRQGGEHHFHRLLASDLTGGGPA